MIDYLEGGSVGGIYGERLTGWERGAGTGHGTGAGWQKVWKKDDWNCLSPLPALSKYDSNRTESASLFWTIGCK